MNVDVDVGAGVVVDVGVDVGVGTCSPAALAVIFEGPSFLLPTVCTVAPDVELVSELVNVRRIENVFLNCVPA